MTTEEKNKLIEKMKEAITEVNNTSFDMYANYRKASGLSCEVEPNDIEFDLLRVNKATSWLFDACGLLKESD